MKKKSLFIAAIILLIAPTSMIAQEVSIGVKGGLTIPNITPGGKKTPLSEGYSSRLAWGSGLFAEFKFTELFSLQVGLEYSGQGGKKDGIQAVPAGPIFDGIKAEMGQVPGASQIVDLAAGFVPNDYLYSDFKSEVKFDYLMLPVQAKFGWDLGANSPFRVYVSAGLFGSYLLSAERVSTGKSALYADKSRTTPLNYAMANHSTAIGAIEEPTKSIILGVLQGMETPQDMDNTQDITDDIHSLNFGVIGSVGISYAIAPRHKIFIEGGGNYGLIKIQKDDVNGQNRIGAGSVMVGYSFTLGK